MDSELSLQAADKAINKTLAVLDKAGVTEEHIAKRLKEALDAKKGRKADNFIRLDAVKFAATLRNMKPAEKHDINHHGEFDLFLKQIDGESLTLPSQRGKNGDTGANG